MEEATTASVGTTTFICRDGRRLVIRPIRPDDARALQALHRRHSPQTRRMRFFSAMPYLPDGLAFRFANVDFQERAAFVASFDGESEIRAVARYDAVSKDTAEVAFVIEDSLQGHGLGSRLFRVLAEHARTVGYERLVAITLAENHAMMRVFERNARILTIRRESDTLTVEMSTELPERTLVDVA